MRRRTVNCRRTIIAPPLLQARSGAGDAPPGAEDVRHGQVQHGEGGDVAVGGDGGAGAGGRDVCHAGDGAGQALLQHAAGLRQVRGDRDDGEVEYRACADEEFGGIVAGRFG